MLPLDGMRNGGQWMACIRRSFQFDEAKFSASKVILGYRIKEVKLSPVCLCVGGLDIRIRQSVSCCSEG